MELKEGIYERLIDGHTAKAITRAKEAGMHCQQDEIDSAEADQLLADYAAGALRKLLEADESPTMEKIARVNELLRHAGIQEEFLLEEAPRLLSSVLSPERRAQLKVTKQTLVRPQSGFRDSVLFTGGPSTELSLSSELLRDIASADEICIIVSFLRLSGLRLLLDALREFCSDPRHRLRIITTTYCGITEARALEQLAQLERTEIRISYDTKIERSLWKNGGYDTSRLSAKLRDAERLGLIIGKLKQYLPDEKDCRALCFCCDKEHAVFMAHGLQEAGLKAAVLTSDTPSSERKHLAKDLAEKCINYLCCVDIFNEGVDIPEVDTALFLRPTNSLTIFLQQLGRGLRISAGKDYLTVLDFVAQANNKYDFTSRFRSLCLRPDRDIKKQVRDGFTTLPQGCSIHMERVAREHILHNIQNAIYTKRRLVRELQGYPNVPILSEFIASNGQDIRLLYRAGYCWTTLKRDAGKCPSFEETKLTKLLVKGIKGLIHINSSSFLHAIQSYLRTGKFFNPTPGLSPQERERQEHFKLMLYYNLFREEPCKVGYASAEEALSELRSHTLFKQEVLELTDYLLSELPFMTATIAPDLPLGLELHGSYTREEVFILFGRQTETKRMQGSMGGVFSIEERNLELLFVTLNKSDKDFSPSTQYDDYFISERLFHWQSPNTLAHDNRGKRYLQRGKKPRRFILFVREHKMDDYRNTSTFLCLGFANYRSSYGDFPMSIEWELQEAAPAHLLRPV